MRWPCGSSTATSSLAPTPASATCGDVGDRDLQARDELERQLRDRLVELLRRDEQRRRLAPAGVEATRVARARAASPPRARPARRSRAPAADRLARRARARAGARRRPPGRRAPRRRASSRRSSCISARRRPAGARSRSSRSSIAAAFSLCATGLAIRRAVHTTISSRTTRLFSRSVVPVAVRSTIASTMPVSGASSTEPLTSTISAWRPVSSRWRAAMRGYLVATRITPSRRSASSAGSGPALLASTIVQRP